MAGQRARAAIDRAQRAAQVGGGFAADAASDPEVDEPEAHARARIGGERDDGGEPGKSGGDDIRVRVVPDDAHPGPRGEDDLGELDDDERDPRARRRGPRH
jgi:hypothetical protein